ncbi:hypothetical protein, partial [Streptococcus halichoeri]|uniref:hypothetical protein n=1 Tax=Streptococcus halichoeri TaxID=254785 RepID=UPI001F2A2E14
PLVSDIDKKTELSPGLNSVDFKRFSQTKCQFDETGTYFGNLRMIYKKASYRQAVASFGTFKDCAICSYD